MDKVVKMQQKKQRPMVVGGLVICALVLVVVLALFGLSSTIGEINEIALSETPEAVLASAGLTNRGEVVVPVAYFDQKEDACVNMYETSLRHELLARQFGWTNCDYGRQEVEQGLVDYYLSEDGSPVGLGGQLTANKGMSDLSRWFDSVEGKSKRYPGTLSLRYVEKELKFSYESDEFYPLDDVDFSNGDSTSSDGHNHFFTMSMALPFNVLSSGNERLEIAADDDIFVFVNDSLAIDMGGVHGVEYGEIWINESGEVYAGSMGQELAFSGIKVKVGDNAVIRVFHADRDINGSVFRLNLYGIEPKVVNTQIADEDGVQIAYDPNDPMHAAPLGVSTSTKQDNKKSYAVIATIYGTTIIVVALGIAMLARYLIRAKR